MDDLHRWADKINPVTDYAFTQFLLGNRTFDECARDALDRVLGVEDVNGERALDGIEWVLDELEGDESASEELVAKLEDVRDMLKERFHPHDGDDDRVAFPTGASGILPDHEIVALAHAGMITPFESSLLSKSSGAKVLSYGVSSYGYDARVSEDFKVFTNTYGSVVDPKNFDDRSFVDVRAQPGADGYSITIPPNSFVLGRTVERFRIPRDVMVVCVGKSTYARCGIIVNVTPLEPEWEGHVTLEFSNTTPLPAKLYANEGACQFLFLRSASPCQTSYADRKGKYQGQSGVTLPRLAK